VRRLGLGLICAGLIVGLMVLTFGELGAVGASSRAEMVLETMFYAAVAMCGLGALLIVVRIFMARRGI